MTCKLSIFCDNIRQLLLDIGVAKDDIDYECVGSSLCKSAVYNCHLLTERTDPDTFDDVLQFLQKLHGGNLPLDHGQVASNLIFQEIPFRCPELGVDIYQPCQVKSCAFHTDYMWSRNCILCYKTDHKRDELDVKELTILTGKTPTEIKQIQRSALQHMRTFVLQDKVKDEEHIEPQMSEDTCCVCGTSIEDPYHLSDVLLYCSDLCYRRKPPLDFELEERFRLSLYKILKISVACFASLQAVCHALDLTLPQFRSICQRYGVDISNLY